MLALRTSASIVLLAAPRAPPRAVAAPARTCAGTGGCRRGEAGGRLRPRGRSRHGDRREGAEDTRGRVGSNGSIGGFAPPLRSPGRRARGCSPDRRLDPLRGFSCDSLSFHRAAAQKNNPRMDRRLLRHRHGSFPCPTPRIGSWPASKDALAVGLHLKSGVLRAELLDPRSKRHPRIRGDARLSGASPQAPAGTPWRATARS